MHRLIFLYLVATNWCGLLKYFTFYCNFNYLHTISLYHASLFWNAPSNPHIHIVFYVENLCNLVYLRLEKTFILMPSSLATVLNVFWLLQDNYERFEEYNEIPPFRYFPEMPLYDSHDSTFRMSPINLFWSHAEI